MPITHSAIKKLRVDKRKTEHNKRIKRTLKVALKEAISSSKPEALIKAYSTLDKAAKRGIIHKNTASRKKSNLAKQFKSDKPITKKPTAKRKKINKPK